MSPSARITSIDALEITAAALQRFRSECAGALDELQLATRRAAAWIQHDRKDYWARELRHSEEAVTQARIELRQARSTRRVANTNREPTCIDEERALQRAQRRHEIAEEKLEAVRRCMRSIDHAVDQYQRHHVRFLLWLDGDLVKAVAALHRMSESLESYTSLDAPSRPIVDGKEAGG